MTHMFGPAPHATHVPCALVNENVRQWLRAVLGASVNSDEWQRMWEVRWGLHSGPSSRCRVPCVGCVPLGVVPLRWSFAGKLFAFAPASLLDKIGEADAKVLMTDREAKRILHDARVFLRMVLAYAEARRRPKDFGGLQDGWSELREHRELSYRLLLHAGGPSLATVGAWTAIDVSRLARYRGQQRVFMCPRCGSEPETTLHSLWTCHHNAPFRRALDASVPGNVS